MSLERKEAAARIDRMCRLTLELCANTGLTMEPLEERVRDALGKICLRLNGWGPMYGSLAQSVREWALNPVRARKSGWLNPCESFNLFLDDLDKKQRWQNQRNLY